MDVVTCIYVNGEVHGVGPLARVRVRLIARRGSWCPTLSNLEHVGSNSFCSRVEREGPGTVMDWPMVNISIFSIDGRCMHDWRLMCPGTPGTYELKRDTPHTQDSETRLLLNVVLQTA
jgi:hypothetical protein